MILDRICIYAIIMCYVFDYKDNTVYCQIPSDPKNQIIKTTILMFDIDIQVHIIAVSVVFRN